MDTIDKKQGMFPFVRESGIGKKGWGRMKAQNGAGIYPALRKVALGEQPAELVIKRANVLNVYTDEFCLCDVAVEGGLIAGLGEYQGKREIDAQGRYLVPGLIDAHLHIESSMLTPGHFAGLVARHGTTVLIADPHEIANVKGEEGIRYMLHAAKDLPLHLFLMLPSCVPATPFDSGGACLEAAQLSPFLREGAVYGLGEMMNYAGVVAGDQTVLQKLSAFSHLPIDGHAPGLVGKELQAYRLAGIRTEHECATGEEMREKLRAGFAIWIREGSGAKNLDTLISCLVREGLPANRCGFCTDDRHIDDIEREGHISHCVRRAIELGMDPVQAYKTASFYPAQLYGLNRHGAISPGCHADFLLLDGLEQVDIHSVFFRGKQVEQELDGREEEVPSALLHTVHLPPLTVEDFRLEIGPGKQPVIVFLPRQIGTKLSFCSLPSSRGRFLAQGEYRKAVVVERHRAKGNIGVGVVQGFPIRGTIASTVAHDSHNLVMIGDSDTDMLLAAQTLQRCGGGYVLVRDGQVLACLPLPVCGLMSPAPAKEVEGELIRMASLARDMGIPADMDPFQTMSFLSLPVIPEGRITDRGVFDVQRLKYLQFEKGSGL